MNHLRFASTPGQPGAASPVRAEQIRPAPRTGLGYSFDPIPRFLDDLIRDRKLKAVDELVLKHLLRFRRLPDSAWTTKAVLAAAIRRTPRTVQSSLARLTDAGVIAQTRVPIPDLDDPRNVTGWRFVFLWMVRPGRIVAAAVDRRTNDERRCRMAVAPAHEISPPRQPSHPLVSCPSAHGISPPREQKISPKYSDGIERETPPSSSSSARPDDDEISLPERGGEGVSPPATLGVAVEAVRMNLGEDAAAIVAGDAEEIANAVRKDRPADLDVWTLVEHAAYMARRNSRPIGNPKRWLITVARSFPESGPSAEARLARKAALAAAARRQAVDAPPPLSLETQIHELEGALAESRAVLEDDNQLPSVKRTLETVVERDRIRLGELRARLGAAQVGLVGMSNHDAPGATDASPGRIPQRAARTATAGLPGRQEAS